jgi:tripeptidyl-peptidase-1
MAFLNPRLYSKGYQEFTEILSGISGGCNTTGVPATEGWDTVTGFGTPVIPKIVALAQGDPDFGR